MGVHSNFSALQSRFLIDQLQPISLDTSLTLILSFSQIICTPADCLYMCHSRKVSGLSAWSLGMECFHSPLTTYLLHHLFTKVFCLTLPYSHLLCSLSLHSTLPWLPLHTGVPWNCGHLVPQLDPGRAHTSYFVTSPTLQVGRSQGRRRSDPDHFARKSYNKTQLKLPSRSK